MLGCRRVRGLIAESLYEELCESDRAVLEGHLEGCARCRAEADGLGQFVKSIPSTAVALDRDLVPALRARLDERPAVSVGLGLRLAVSGAAAFVLVAAVVGYGLYGTGPAVQDGPMAVAPVGGPQFPSFLRADLDRAKGLVEDHNFSGAYVVLQAALERRPGDRLAGEVQLLAANIAFAELQWYPEAFTAYSGLRLEFGDLFREDPEHVYRWNLLDETRGAGNDYALLHAVDAARNGGDFEGLEEVIGRKPAAYVASLAAKEMARLAVGADGGAAGENARLYAMQSALDRCTNPIAVAQLKVEIGHIFRDELGDFGRARSLYEQVADAGPTVFAQLARESILSLP